MRGKQRWAVMVIAGGLMLVAGCTGGSSSSSGEAGGTGAPRSEAPAAELVVTPADGSADVSPVTPVQLSVTDGALGEVTVTDGTGTVVPGSVGEVVTPAAPADGAAPTTGDGGDPAATTAVWTPDDQLGYGTTYTVSATASNADDVATEGSTTFSTVVPASVTTPSVGPLDGTTVGVGMPIRVFFDQPVTDQAAVESHLLVTSSTPTDGRWNWVSDSEVHFRPSTYWPANTQVTLDADLYGVDTGGGIYGEKDRTVSFTVGEKHVSVADAGAYTLTVYDSDQLVQTYPMSAGSSENPTRNGAHVVLEKYEDITMDSSTFGLAVDAAGGYRTDVQYATRISNNGEFVHAAPWSVGQQGASNVSHGCINLSTDRAQWFYDFSQPGDVVEVVNSIGPTLGPVDGDIYDWAIPWDQWVAGSALD